MQNLLKMIYKQIYQFQNDFLVYVRLSLRAKNYYAFQTRGKNPLKY